MMYGGLPVTLPINATEDRVIGGWNIDELMRSKPTPQAGLLEEANGSLLYVDEINLLDDHIVNLILDVTSTGVLVVQREGRRDPPKEVSFTLVGTMNPEEGWLRPQLRDRFGLMVNVTADKDHRAKVLQTVLDYDRAVFALRHGSTAGSRFLDEGYARDRKRRDEIDRASKAVYEVEVPPAVVDTCARLAEVFQAEGHRGDYVMALAARAHAALKGDRRVTHEHLGKVAPLALQHRRAQAAQGQRELWTTEDKALLQRELANPTESRAP
jgi:magnesium chelatase subunit I